MCGYEFFWPYITPLRRPAKAPAAAIQHSRLKAKVLRVIFVRSKPVQEVSKSTERIMSSEGPMSEDAQMRLKKGATKGGLTRADGSKPDVDDGEVQKKGGMSKEAQERLIEGARKGGRARAEQLGREGYQEMGRKGGLSTMDMSGEEAAKAKGIQIDEAKYKTVSPLSSVAKTQNDEEGDDKGEKKPQKSAKAQDNEKSGKKLQAN